MNQQKLKQNNQKVCIQHGRRQSMIRDFRGSQATVKRATCTLLLRGMLIAAIALIVPGSVLVALFAPQTAQAQTPNTTVNFQARILTSTGAIVPDGNYHIEFKLYDSVGSGASAQGVCSLNSSTDDCWWLETRSTGNLVRVVNGYISVNLGSVTAFGSSIPWSQDLYVTMRVGGTSGPSWDNEMTNGGNRMKLNVAPLALVSNNVRTANRTSTASDNITIQTGNTTTSGNSGNVAIDVGTAAGTAGTISLGTVNSSAITLGRSGLTTSNAGALTIAQLLSGNLGATISGATINLNDSSNFGTNINTGTSSGAVNIGNSLSNLTVSSTSSNFFSQSVVLENPIDNTSAFLVNNSAGNYLLNVDTQNSTVVAGHVWSNDAFKVTAGNSIAVLGVNTNTGVVSLGTGSSFQGQLTFASSSNSNIATLRAENTLGANVTYELPNVSAGTYGICTTANNCSAISSALTDNIVNALDIQQGSDNYFNINTTNSSENISFGNATTNPSYNLLGSGRLTVGSALTNLGAKLAIVGTADEEQLLIRSNSTQSNTSPVILVTDSAGAELFSVRANRGLFIGQDSGVSITSGVGNSAFGYRTLVNTSTNNYNAAFGDLVLQNVASDGNTGLGIFALSTATTGDGQNTAVGVSSLQLNSTGEHNTAVGADSGLFNETGSHNSIFGTRAGSGVSGNSYSNNSFFGYRTGNVITTGSNNILLGYQAGDNLTTGANNIIIGYDLDASAAGVTNELRIGGVLQGNTSTLALTTNGNLTVGNNSGNVFLILDSSAAGTAIIDFDQNNGTDYIAFDNNTNIFTWKAAGVDRLTVSGSGLNVVNLITGQAGLTVTGAAVNLNASSNFATNINTGTSTGVVSIGNSLSGVTTIQGAASATALQVLDASSASLLTVDTSARSGSGGNLLKVGNSTGTDTATTILQLDAATAVPTTNLSALNGGLFYNSTTNKVSIIENGVVKVVCNSTDASCGGNSTTLQQSYDADADGSDATIALTSTDGSLILSNPSSGGSTSAYILNINQQATGAVGGLDVQSAGTGNLFRVRDTTATAADVLTIADGGATTFRSQTNSTSAFRVQNAAGSDLLNIDTTGLVVNIASEAEFSSYIDSPYGGFGVVGTASAGNGNLLANTQSLDNGTWVRTNITSVTDGATAPNGNANADTIITTGSGTHTLVQTETNYMATGTYTFSVWLKSSTSEVVQLRIDAAGGTISPTTGTATSHTTSSAWKRYSVTQTFTGAGATSLSPTIVIPGHTATVVAWGAQLVTGSERGVYAVGSTINTSIFPNTAIVAQGSIVLQDQWEKSGAISLYSLGGAENGMFVADVSGSSTGSGLEIFQFKGSGGVALRVRTGQYSVFEQGLQTTALLVGTNDFNLTASADLSFDSTANRTLNVNARTTAGAGRTLTISAGQSNGANAGGLLTLQGGAAAATSGAAGGAVTLTGAAGTSTSTGGNGGAVTISGGAGTSSGNRSGGAVSVTAGLSTGNATGGTLSVTSGRGGATGVGGALTVTSGAGGATSGNSGAVSLQSGNVTSGTAGNVTIDVGTSTSGTPAISVGNSTNSVAKTITIGGTTQTGTITLGAATTATTQAIDISSANSTASTQTITIGGGTSTTSGGKIVNIATGVPGASTTNTVAIGSGGTTTGTVGVTIGSVGGAAHTTLLQGGNGATALRLVTASGGTLSVGNNGVASTIQVGNTTGAFTQTINIGNNATASSTTNIVIGSTIAGTTSLQGTLTIGSASTETVTFNSTVLANNASTGSSINTSGTGTNTGTVTLASSGFANGDIIFIDNVGQDYYTRVTAGGGTASLTVDPVVTFEATRPVIKYNVQNLGAVNTGTTFANANRFFQGYFLGGVVTGAGSTTLSDGNLVSTNSLNIRASGNLTVGASDTTATQLVVDTKTSAGDPTGVNGGIYYNSSSSKFRCFQASAWADCVPTSSGANTTLSNLGTTAINASLLLDSDDIYNIGADAIRLHDLYSAGTIHLGTSTAAEATISRQSGGLTFIATVTTENFVFGSSDTFGQLVVLDTKTGSGDPTCVNGGMYYNSNSASFRVCKNSAWVTLVAGVDIQNFTANGNWTRPSGTSVVMVIMCGGGGSGGGGFVGSGGGGTGGGGGAYVVNTFSAGDTVAVGATVAVTVGASTTGGTVGNNGNAGNYSSFGAFVKASGGGAGGAGASTTASGGGGGGMVTVGGAGGASNSAGGENTGSGSAGTGWSGGGGVLNGAGTSAQMGGGAGGGSIGNAIGKAGGGSIYGGAGGGGGGGSGVGGPYAGAAGGGTGLYTSGGGGAAGATDTGGTAGTAGNSTHCGTGGGGGGARSATAGGVGGAGGTAGGAGGGGGAGSSAGAGGAGGRGEVWVYSW